MKPRTTEPMKERLVLFMGGRLAAYGAQKGWSGRVEKVGP